MRIAQLCPPILPIPPEGEGGTERHVADLTHGLLAAGHEVTLFAPSDSTLLGLEKATLVGCGGSLSSRTGPPPSLPGALEAISLANLLEHSGDFDLIHCHTEFSHYPALQQAACPVVTTLHWRTDEADRQEAFAAFPDANLVAISESQKKGIPNPSRVTVIPHGLRKDRYRVGPGGGGYLAFLGRLTDQKGPERTMDIARDAKMPVRLAGGHDVGNPTFFESEIRPRLQQPDLDCELVGVLDDVAKQTFLGRAEALVFPIQWDEPFGLVMIEAMACGCPVIAFNRGSVPEVIADGVNGFIVEDEVGAVSALARLSELDRAQVRASFDKNFTSEVMTSHYLELFQNLTKTHHNTLT